MHKGRLEAFSDGVFAIIITIMVLELKVPHGSGLQDLLDSWPTMLSYVLSFIYAGIYWNNHHHLFQIVHKVTGGVLWANLHLLFWLSLLPFTTAWYGQNSGKQWPVAVYGLNLLFAGTAYLILSQVLIKEHGPNSALKKALGRDVKGMISAGLYLTAVLLTVWIPLVSVLIYYCVAAIWIIPDRRIEKVLEGK